MSQRSIVDLQEENSSIIVRFNETGKEYEVKVDGLGSVKASEFKKVSF